MKVFISCGETSGDHYGASVVQALQSIQPSLQVFANGGSELKKAGASILSDTTSKSTIGFIEPIQHIGYFIKLMAKTKSFIKKESIDIVIIIDHQGFNIPLAKWCKKQSIPVASVFAPQFWMWGNEKQAKKFLESASIVACVFSKEYDFYSSLDSKKTVFIGHPLVVELPEKKQVKQQILGLFPGSRAQEIKLLLPTIIKAAEQINKRLPNMVIKVAISSNHYKSDIQAAFKNSKLRVEFVSNSRQLIAEATCSIASSGTVTLEHALIGTPCVVIYKLSRLSYAIAHFFVMKKIQEKCHGFIAMPNILAKKKILPEFLQHDVTEDIISNEVLNIVSDVEYQNKMHVNFQELKKTLVVDKNPFEPFARLVCDLIKK